MNWKFSDLTETLQADGERGARVRSLPAQDPLSARDRGYRLPD